MASYEKITISTGSRLHFNSLKMNAIAGRGCGGIGLALKKPGMHLTFSKADTLTVDAPSGHCEKIVAYATHILRELDVQRSVHIELHDSFSSHIGLGSGTQLGLATGVGLSLLYGRSLMLSDIARITERSGVSGVGYYCFSQGGLVVDGGYPMGQGTDKRHFGDHAQSPPPLIGSYEFPLTWKVLLLTPPRKVLPDFDENEYFGRHTPVPVSDVGGICTSTLMGIIPSVLERRYAEFMQSLKSIAALGTKNIELELNLEQLLEAEKAFGGMCAYRWSRSGSCRFGLSANTEDVEEYLRPTGAYHSEVTRNLEEYLPPDKIPFLALTSLGPTMYTFLLEGYHNITLIRDGLSAKLPAEWHMTITEARNSGCEIAVDDHPPFYAATAQNLGTPPVRAVR